MLEFTLQSYNSYLFVNRKEIYKFKADNKMLTTFSLESISNVFGVTESREITLKGKLYVSWSIRMLIISLTY